MANLRIAIVGSGPSGGGEDAIAEQHRARPRLQKPFTLNSVEAAVAQLGGGDV